MAGLFDKQSDLYAAARPNYPDSLFALLTSLTRHHYLAWDVGTGNGHAAVDVGGSTERQEIFWRQIHSSCG
ncbi:hypothetical protein O6H91_08G060600 [Diphasiastrum complanatum]|uniref:Uncharacterized protein n=1 Tax=Diphasiastrum complanatum TaxID=34168 RepID=A0ACC2CY26_DIPCM|nr:hypothetical protein O6H91_08G060600 [Diphasiastrum complanatum]